jgi:hypothetical protein
LQPSISDLEVRTSGALKETGFRKVRLCPSDPVVEHPLPAAGEKLNLILFVKLKLKSQRGDYLRDPNFAIRCGLEHWQHKRLIVRDGHDLLPIGG